MKPVYAPLRFSPDADVPLCTLSPADQAALYFSRTEESFSPYTVERVLREVYRRDFRHDLPAWLSSRSRGFRDDGGELWNVTDVQVSDCELLGTESVLEQALDAFYAELTLRARVRVRLVDRGLGSRTRARTFAERFCLRYCFDFTPTVLRYEFCGVITEEGDRLPDRAPDAIRLNEYLLPVMEGEDFARFADRVRYEMLGIAPEEDAPLSAIGMAAWMRVAVREMLPEDEEILGEYLFRTAPPGWRTRSPACRAARRWNPARCCSRSCWRTRSGGHGADARALPPAPRHALLPAAEDPRPPVLLPHAHPPHSGRGRGRGAAPADGAPGGPADRLPHDPLLPREAPRR